MKTIEQVKKYLKLRKQKQSQKKNRYHSESPMQIIIQIRISELDKLLDYIDSEEPT